MTPLVFTCEGASIAGALHDAHGAVGILIIPGGAQTRVGAHRMFVVLADSLAARGMPVLRFDRRGTGDSDGDDAGFLGSGPDIAAAAAALRTACPAVRHVVAIGHCDGATALALANDGIDALVLMNPWTIDDDAEAPARVVGAHYRRRLLQPASWLRLLSGGVDIRAALASLFGATRAPRLSVLGARLADAIEAAGKPFTLILSDRDTTAIAAGTIADRLGQQHWIAGADHGFSSPRHLAEAEHLIAAFIEKIW